MLFGLTSSPFLLGGVIEAHLSNWEEKEPDVVAKLRKELYVDDLISGAITVHKAREVKDKATIIFQDACFTLRHKWHSNAPELEAVQSSTKDTEEATYAKQQLDAPRGTMSSMLGLPWNKERDTVSVEVPSEQATLTKRGILVKLARIYDPLGLALMFVIQREPGMQSYHVTWRKPGSSGKAVCHEAYRDRSPLTEMILTRSSYIPTGMRAQMV